jgi:hypothetical protein
VLLAISLADQPRAAEEEANSKACPASEVKLDLRTEDANGEKAWSACEKWVWSCILQGKEANLYEKKCFVPRSKENSEARADKQYEPFVNPDSRDKANLLGDGFLRTILWQEEYAKKIPPLGVRIYGAYFKDPVNLENVATSVNLVIDGSVFKKGVRLTNYRSTKNVSFDGSNIRGSTLLLRIRLDGSLFLQRGVYDTVDLRDARIGSSIDAARSVFTDDFRMDRAHIEGKVNLVKSRLTVINAWDTVIGGSLELRLSDIRLRADLTGATVNGDVRMQRIAFGRKTDQMPSCDWDTSTPGDHLLSDLQIQYASDSAALQRIAEETVLKRPASEGRPAIGNICVELLKEAREGASNEVLLRDMKIKGNLCLIDLSGEILGGNGREHLDIISLDGTQANSTVLRWKDSPSETLWHVVNFKTPYMLINLESQPKQHFIDNMEVGFIAFVKKGLKEPPPEASDENVDKYLCDVTPRPENAMPAWSDAVHRRLVQFFAGPANKSRSAQPFSKIVERLEESGATSTYLKIRLSEYKLNKVCATSAVSKELNTLDDLGWLTFPQKLAHAWSKVRASTEDAGEVHDVFGESNRLFWDGVCSGGMMVYRGAVSYGHEPYNLFYYAVLFIGVFWLLLRLDKSVAEGEGNGRRLGLTYALDTFVPLAQLRLDRRNASALPNHTLLRIYLRFHRFAGFVFAVLVFLFIYRAAK